MKKTYMEEALKEAIKALEIDEVPIGAVIVKDNVIIGRGHNLKESLNDPTMHAEIIAIKDACRNLGTWRLTDCDMYVTIEPCVMCAGAIYQSRIRSIIIGSPDEKAGGVVSLYNILFDERLNHQVKVYLGIMKKECSNIMKSFFSELRKRK
ncbi:tRNA adenosine(34) deaminase TadA [Clostridiaceae bacterium HSG29]|nr:tRNA adenosine(34) deaminase TadA [Clostridiaceae bacterium HSG29]